MERRVLSFHYILTNKNGETVDSSRDTDPFVVLEGSQQIIPGLEEELFKMLIGQKKKIDVPAAKAYGAVNEELKMSVPRAQLPAGDIQVGTQFTAGQEGHGMMFVVTKIEGEQIFLDGNHPLAGEDLTFDVEVLDVRPATKEELTHGHAHGPHGHHH